MNTSDLLPYIGNARTHAKEQVNLIAASIKEFGFNNPILIDGTSGIIAGHGRLEAAKKLGMIEVPVIELSHLSDAQKRAYILADNRLALDAGWDDSILSAELKRLTEDEFDLSLTGFSKEELDKLLGADAPVVGLTDEDEVPEQAPAVCQRGQIWLLGKHRLMCGDSTSEAYVAKLMDGQKADLVFTDPPYGVEYQSKMRTKSKKFDVLKNDHHFLDIAPVIHCHSQGWVFVWTSWKVQVKWLDQFDAFGYPSNIVIWHKPGGGMGDLKKTFLSDYEVALVWHRGAELCGERIGSVWTINKDGTSSYIHPTQKPVALACEAIDKTTNECAKILDLFGGSGSTLIACEKTNRVCYMMELDEHYCDVIIARWEKYTGKKAELCEAV